MSRLERKILAQAAGTRHRNTRSARKAGREYHRFSQQQAAQTRMDLRDKVPQLLSLLERLDAPDVELIPVRWIGGIFTKPRFRMRAGWLLYEYSTSRYMRGDEVTFTHHVYLWANGSISFGSKRPVSHRSKRAADLMVLNAVNQMIDKYSE